MNWIYVAAYLSIAIAFGWWQETMDARYGVRPGASTSVGPLIVISLVWPMGIPLAMAAVAGNGWGRWTLSRS